MKLPFTPDLELFNKINRVTNIIYQSERVHFGDCERIVEQIIEYLYKEGLWAPEENSMIRMLMDISADLKIIRRRTL